MSKLTGKFTTVPWAVNGKSGYWLRFLPGDAIKDESFLREVIYRAGLNYTAEELLHAFRAVAKYGPILASEDGRSRIVTGFIEFLVRLSGSVDSPDGAYNPSLHQCVVKAKLRYEAIRKVLDVSMSNVNAGVGVNLDNVTYLGATGIQNVIKPGVNFAAYGDHMEMLEGDTASLIYGETVIPLVCVSSDVSKAEFEFPMEAAPIPADTNVTFELRSRGGVEDGQVYVNRKAVKMGTYTGTPLIAYFEQEGKERGQFGVDANATLTIKGTGFTNPNVLNVKIGKLGDSGNTFVYAFNPTAIRVVDANTVTCKVSVAEDPDQTDETLSADSESGNIKLRLYTQMTKSNDVVAHYVE